MEPVLLEKAARKGARKSAGKAARRVARRRGQASAAPARKEVGPLDAGAASVCDPADPDRLLDWADGSSKRASSATCSALRPRYPPRSHHGRAPGRYMTRRFLGEGRWRRSNISLTSEASCPLEGGHPRIPPKAPVDRQHYLPFRDPRTLCRRGGRPPSGAAISAAASSSAPPLPAPTAPGSCRDRRGGERLPSLHPGVCAVREAGAAGDGRLSGHGRARGETLDLRLHRGPLVPETRWTPPPRSPPPHHRPRARPAHRAIEPASILLGPTAMSGSSTSASPPSPPRPVLTPTMSRHPRGFPYRAPEQWRGAPGMPSPTSGLWDAVLFEMLPAAAARRLRRRAEPLPVLRGEPGRELARIVGRALRARPPRTAIRRWEMLLELHALVAHRLAAGALPRDAPRPPPARSARAGAPRSPSCSPGDRAPVAVLRAVPRAAPPPGGDDRPHDPPVQHPGAPGRRRHGGGLQGRGHPPRAHGRPQVPASGADPRPGGQGALLQEARAASALDTRTSHHPRGGGTTTASSPRHDLLRRRDPQRKIERGR